MKKIKMLLLVAIATGSTLMLANDLTFARGTSAAVRLDLRTGTRIASVGAMERITYSPRWGNATSCTVSSDGTILKTDNVEGVVNWSSSGVGAHTLLHTAGDDTLTARFAVLGDDVVVHSHNITTNELLVTWSADKVHLVTVPIAVEPGCSLTIASGAVVKFMSGAGIEVAQYGSSSAIGVTFTHVNDDTVGGDTLFDGDSTAPVMGDYTITGNITDDDSTEYRYLPPQTLTDDISSDTRLRGYCTYIVSNSVTVASGATLTLQPGTILKFNTGCSLTVNGTLDAQGTRAAPIVFTSLKDDAHGGDTNGDGDKTYPWAGDWGCVLISGGNIKASYCRFTYGSGVDGNQYGARACLFMWNGGSGTFDGCWFSGSTMDGCFAQNATFRNCIFTDCDRGLVSHAGTITAINCVAAFNRIGFFSHTSPLVVRNSISSLNLESAITGDGGSRQTYNCYFGNDPKFLDPENGDFRIAKNSPCINAGNAAYAPEFDYYGQPRDGAPDIGIYEVVSETGYDLSASSVSAQETNLTMGNTINVTYSIANVGREGVSDQWHDALYLVSSVSGRQYALGEPLNPGGLGAGETRTFTLRFALPVVPEGQYRLRLVVNSRRMDVPEGASTENNAVVSEGEIEVVADSIDATDGANGSVAAGASSVCAFTLPSGFGDRLMRVTSSAGGATLSARCGLGFLPVNADAETALSFSGGAAWISVPAGTEKVWLILDNGGTAAASYEVEFLDGSLTLSGISPASIPSSGNVTVEIAGAGFTDECEVSFTGEGTVAPLSVKRVSQGLLVVTVDAAAFASGKTYSVAVRKGTETKTLQDALSVAAAPGKPKFWAKLDMPSSMRQGRLVETCFIEYGNSGTADMLSPVLQVSMTGDGTLGYIGGLSGLKTLQFVAAGDAGSAGVLRPGSSHRIRFAVRAGASNKISLHTSEGSDYAPAPWTNAADYLSDLSAAATRIDLRGQDATDYVRVFDLAKAVKKGYCSIAIFGIVSSGDELLQNISVSALNVEGEVRQSSTDSAGKYVVALSAGGEWRINIGGIMFTTNLFTDVLDKDVRLDCDMFKGASIVVHLDEAEKDVAIVAVNENTGMEFHPAIAVDGTYSFYGLSDGIYRITSKNAEKIGVGYSIVDSNEEAAFTYIAMRKTGNISGVVNGVTDVEGCAVMICNAVDAHVVPVAEDGSYSLSDLPPGEYVVSVCGVDYDKYEITDGVLLEEGGSLALDFTPIRSTTISMGKSPVRAKRQLSASKGSDEVDIPWWRTTRSVAKEYYDEGMRVFMSAGPIIRPDAEHDCPHNMQKYDDDRAVYNQFSMDLVSFIAAYGKTDGWKFAAYLSKSVGIIGEALSKAYNPALGKVAAAKKYVPVCRRALQTLVSSGVALYSDVQKIDETAGDIEKELEYLESLLKTQADATRMSESISRLSVYADQMMRGCKKFHYYNNGGKMWGTMFKGLSTAASAVSSILSLKEAYETGYATGEAAAELQWGVQKMKDLLPIFKRKLDVFKERSRQFNQYPLCCQMCYPERPYDPPVDNKTPSVPKSCDPNEMMGEYGVGDARYVKPGQELTYTIYFENKAGFDIADAQEVKVTNPLSEWLDWSTFEMREVAFNNQCDVNLDRLANGTSEVQMTGTNKYVRTTVEYDAGNGVVTWYMRVYDPHGDSEGYPLDGSGFLPPNDDTHRGEGHLMYRIRVRKDAPTNAVITNSATIVFDYENPIETDPAWWNTVARMAHVKMTVDGVEQTLDLIVGRPYGELPTPKPWAGHTFAGWYTEPNGNGRRVTAQSLVEAGDTNLYAHWLTNAYTVCFNANGGEGLMSNQPFEFDKPGALDMNAFTFDGHKFAGWATNATGEVVHADGATVTNLTAVDGGVVTLYAIWTEIPSEPEPERPEPDDPTTEQPPVQEPANDVAEVVETYGGAAADVSFAVAQKVMGALYRNGVLVGTVELKFGKRNAKKGTVKVSASATIIVGGKAKKIGAKAVNMKFDGGRMGDTLTFKAPINGMKFEMGADGVFTLTGGGYEMVGAVSSDGALRGVSAGGALSKSLMHFNVAMGSVPNFGAGLSLLEAALPTNVPVHVSGGTKWSCDKAASLKYKKIDGAYRLTGLDGAANGAGLKLSYAPKTGVFKGSYRLYATSGGEKPKLKKFTVNVIGFVVDGKGQGEATMKKPAAGPWPVTVK